MSFLDFLKRFDHEDKTNHQWSKWEAIILNVKSINPLSGQILEGKQDAQKRKCLICNKVQTEDVK